MKRVVAALACALGALAVAGPAAAGVSVGVNDDAGKYANGDPQFWQTMKQNGLKQNAVTVLWDETQPLTIVDQSFIQKSLPAAQAAGIKVVFDVYPMHSQAFTKNGATPDQFGAFLKKLAQTFPSVTEYVVMNECNQTRFINPQFDGSGNNQSAAICGAALAAGYDALKSVNATIKVWGVGLSPRGNDNANATSNASTSPVKFLAALGQWYRASGRSQPLMDGFDFHPYPIPQSLPFATGYADTDNAAVSNLPRIYQAFYDGFKGTPQKTIGPGGLPVSLNEVGIQTDNTGKSGYTGTEVSGDANGGVRGDTATEKFQSDWYVQMLNYVACDPSIQVVNLFHLVDEAELGGWQSGLYYVGYQAKQSASAVSQWIAQTGGNCTGASKPWTPTGVTTGGGVTTGSQIDAALQAKIDALIKNGVFTGTGTGLAGSLDGTLTRANVAGLLAQMFGSPQQTTGSFTDLDANDWAAGYVKVATSLVQTAVLPNFLEAGQALTGLTALAFGGFALPTQVTSALVQCTGTCNPSSFAAQALAQCAAFKLCTSSRATASATRVAYKVVATGSVSVKAGAKAAPKLRAVKGAKGAYGSYVLVLRLAPKAAGAKPAAVAVKFTIKKAKPAKATKPAAKPKAKAKKK